VSSGRIGFSRLFVTLPMGALGLSALAFCLPAMAGMDSATATLRARFADPNPDPATVAALRNDLGLTDGAVVQFARFASNALRGDFGLSYTSRVPVGPQARSALWVTLQMVLPATLLAVGFGVGVGFLAAVQKGTAGKLVSAVFFVGAALPAHIIGPLTVLVFGIWFRVLPTGGWGALHNSILPTFVMSIGPTVTIAEVTRTEMLAALGEPFVRTAKSKGLSRVGIARHAFAVSRHGVLAIGTVTLTGLLSGAVLVETIFSVPGLGRFLVNAVRAGDIPALQCGLLFAGSFALVIGAATDGLASLCDPRIRLAER
jgi:ABC-type dipeptide/oligopeptide/nickel transport system permease component